jgi:hypothetical protein
VRAVLVDLMCMHVPAYTHQSCAHTDLYVQRVHMSKHVIVTIGYIAYVYRRSALTLEAMMRCSLSR